MDRERVFQERQLDSGRNAFSHRLIPIVGRRAIVKRGERVVQIINRESRLTQNADR
jgi:hypothetical protein